MAKKKITDLKFDNKNFNKGTQYGKSLMEKSLSKFGAGRSILIDKNNRIIAGNKTTENFGELGLEDVKIVETDGKTLVAVKRNDIDLDTPEGREFALADNQTAKTNIDFDFEIAKDELGDETLNEWGLNEIEKEKEEKGTILFSEEIDLKNNYIVLKFDKDIDFLQVQSILGLQSTYSKRSNGKPWSKGIGRVVDGIDAITKIKELEKGI